ncbi:helix-turn-helix domain-containing protein [Nonomuraea sp. NPDC049028]|uniref:helix-turn-helix domain-containing protein n=1 Tax=Nonomuraea sp. NPDC049028 TaxID=3364348 RepID=UPI00371FD37F
MSIKPMTARPAPYAALAGLLVDLPRLLRRAREARGLTQRAAAEQIGCSKGTVNHIEMGRGCHVSSVVLVLRWLGTPGPSGAHRPQPVQTPVDVTASAVNRTETTTQDRNEKEIPTHG